MHWFWIAIYLTLLYLCPLGQDCGKGYAGICKLKQGSHTFLNKVHGPGTGPWVACTPDIGSKILSCLKQARYIPVQKVKEERDNEKPV